ncbi:MAG: PhoU domain-containing protein [Myxococcales bacterium]|nr:PhoU domain-containing protein [Myxococcales bacterium]
MFKAILDLFRQTKSADRVENDLEAMFSLVREIFDVCTAYILEGTEPPFDVEAKDQEVNALVVSVRKHVVELVTVHPPNDLVEEFIFVTVVNDLERLGDFAKGLLDLGEGKLDGSLHLDELRSVRDGIQVAFESVKTALFNGNRSAGEDALETLDKAGKTLNRLRAELLDEEGDVAPTAFAVAGLRQFVTHLKNTASPAVNPFIYIGTRRKGDAVQDED